MVGPLVEILHTLALCDTDTISLDTNLYLSLLSKVCIGALQQSNIKFPKGYLWECS